LLLTGYTILNNVGVVKGRSRKVEIVILVLALLILDVAAQLYGADSRPAASGRRNL